MPKARLGGIDMNKIKILIADDVEETRNVIKKLLSLENDFFEVVGEAGDGEEVIKIIPKVRPDIVLMDINMPKLNGLEATKKITDQFTEVTVIIMSVQGESEYLKKAMFYGAKEYIIKPFNYETLINTIKTTFERQNERTVKHIDSEEKTKNARMITFFSSKGGVGKSVLAVNTSIELSKFKEKKILLIDMDLLFGDISILVNQYKQKNILDAIDDAQIDSYENIRPYLYEYSSNLNMLFAPKKPEAAEYISKESIEKMMETLKKYYDLIIVDTGVNFNDTSLYILDISEIILFVSTMEIAALKNTKLGLSVMKSLGYDNNKVKLIINKANTAYGISKKEVEDAFKGEILMMIPEDEKVVGISVNNGQPFCDKDKYDRLKIGKAIQTMCQKLGV